MSDAPSLGELSDRFACGECGGRLRITTRGDTDSHTWEWHQCINCGGFGEFHIGEDTAKDGGNTRGVTTRSHTPSL